MLRTRVLFFPFEQLNPALVFLLLQSYMFDIMPFIPNFGVDKYIIHFVIFNVARGFTDKIFFPQNKPEKLTDAS
jgi:hypothetical protein